MASWLWLGSAFSVVTFVCFLVFPLPPLPIRGRQGLLLNSFSIKLTVQCDGCLIWGLEWWAGLVAGLWVGQAYGVFHRPGFGLLVSVPRSLSTQPPFATQALNYQFIQGNIKAPHIMLLLPAPLINKPYSSDHGEFHAYASMLIPLTN